MLLKKERKNGTTFSNRKDDPLKKEEQPMNDFHLLTEVDQIDVARKTSSLNTSLDSSSS
jgi:hypothetical protein